MSFLATLLFVGLQASLGVPSDAGVTDPCQLHDVADHAPGASALLSDAFERFEEDDDQDQRDSALAAFASDVTHAKRPTLRRLERFGEHSSALNAHAAARAPPQVN